MGLRINTNILSLSAQRQLSATTRAFARAMQRLASGSRINSPLDDAAGLAIANRFEAERRGLLQTIRNVNDARGFLSTTDGALETQAALVQRMRELALQASNGTVSTGDRASLNIELQQLLEEFNRITTQTQFNGVNLLDGSFGTKDLQVGSSKGQTISFSLASTQASAVFYQRSTVGTGTFQSRLTVASGAGPLFIDTGDINDDGKIDMISADVSTGLTSVFIGRGDGTFNARTTVKTGGTDSRANKLVDVNGDGYLDIITANYETPGTVSVNLGNGNGTFAARKTLATGGIALTHDVEYADLNGDGKVDIVTAQRQGSGILTIMMGNGDGTFATATTLAAGNNPQHVVIKDFNGDGKLDLAAANASGNTISIYIGNGDGTFGTQSTIATGLAPSYVDSADVNEDGKNDLLFADYNGNTVSVALGNGDGTFQARTALTAGVNPESVRIFDVDGDDHLDLIVNEVNGGAGTTVAVYLGNGNGTFQTRVTYTTGQNPQYVTVADVTGDGVYDILSPDANNNTVSILIGNSRQKTTNPTVAITTQSQAQNMLEIFDNALTYINTARANVGAVMSRLDFTESVSLNSIENISEAKSSLMDTNYAIETAEFTRLQILQEAGLTVLSQANLSARLTLKLLEGL